RGVEAKVRADASANALPKGIAGHKGRLGFVTAARNKARINGHSISQMPVEKARGGSNPVHLTTVLPGPARSLLAGPFSDHAHRRIVQRGGACVLWHRPGVFVVTSRGDEYRRRAKSCSDAAHATENEPTRAALLRLAEDWLRIAESWDDALTDNRSSPRPATRESKP